MAANKISFTQGDTPLIKVPITVNTEVVDLTGYTAFFTLTSQVSPNADTNAEITLDYSLDDTATAWFQTTEIQTSPLEPMLTYNWDVKLKDPSGDFFATIINGTATVKPELHAEDHLMANQEIITMAVDLNGLTTTSTTDTVLISTQTFEADVALAGPLAATIESDSIPMAVALG